MDGGVCVLKEADKRKKSERIKRIALATSSADCHEWCVEEKNWLRRREFCSGERDDEVIVDLTSPDQSRAYLYARITWCVETNKKDIEQYEKEQTDNPRK